MSILTRSSLQRAYSQLLVIGAVLALGFAVGWLASLDRGLVFLALAGAAGAMLLFLRWPSLPIVVIYPFVWIFWSYNIELVRGRPERLISLLALLGMIIIMTRGRSKLFHFPTFVTTGLFLLVGSYILALVAHPNVYGAQDSVVSLVTRLIFLYLAYFHLRTSNYLRWSVGIYIAAGVFAGIFVLGLSYVYGFGFIRETYGLKIVTADIGPLWATTILSTVFDVAPGILVLSLYPAINKPILKMAILALTLFLFGMAFISEIRREILLSVPAILIFLILDKPSGLRKPALSVAILSVLLFLLFIFPLPVFQQRLQGETDLALAGQEPRQVSFQAGLVVFSQSPLLGTGPGSYAESVAPIIGPGRQSWEYYAYNVFIWVAVESGIIGLGGLLLILWGTFKEAQKQREQASGTEAWILRCAPVLIFQIAISFLFGNYWDASMPWYIMGIILAAARLVGSQSEPQMATG